MVERKSELFLGEVCYSFVQLKQLYGVWLPSHGLIGSYDSFISYRWNAFDQEFASLMFDCLSAQELPLGAHTRACSVFWDVKRLESGGDFRQDFMEAMWRSLGVVPIVSIEALQRMTTITAHSPCDNVLLEWTLALELLEARRIHFIFPLMIGRKNGSFSADQGKVFSSFFAVKPVLPEVVCATVVKSVVEFLARHGVTPSPDLRTRTVQGVLDGIISKLGKPVEYYLPDQGVVAVEPAFAEAASLIGLHHRVKENLLSEVILPKLLQIEVTQDVNQFQPPHVSAASKAVQGGGACCGTETGKPKFLALCVAYPDSDLASLGWGEFATAELADLEQVFADSHVKAVDKIKLKKLWKEIQ